MSGEGGAEQRLSRLEGEVQGLKGEFKGHQDECGRRYKETADQIAGLNGRMDKADEKRSGQFQKVHQKMDQMQAAIGARLDRARDRRETMLRGGAVALIMLLLGALGYLITEGRPWTPKDAAGPASPVFRGE